MQIQYYHLMMFYQVFTDIHKNKNKFDTNTTICENFSREEIPLQSTLYRSRITLPKRVFPCIPCQVTNHP